MKAGSSSLQFLANSKDSAVRSTKTPMASTQKKSDALLEEEAIIKKRFLTQTAVATSSGGGPPFRKLVESYKVFCESDSSSAERAQECLDTLLSDVHSIHSYINKLEIVMGVYQKEQSLYHGRHADLLTSIDKAGVDIRARKLELEQARREMAQAKECEHVKEQIVKIPARSATVLEIDAVKKEIEELQNQRQQLHEATSRRISQFKTILESIECVEEQLNAEKEGDEDDDAHGGDVDSGDDMVMS